MSLPFSAFSLFHRVTRLNRLGDFENYLQLTANTSQAEICVEEEVLVEGANNLDEGDDDESTPEERDPHLTEEEEEQSESSTSAATSGVPLEWEEVDLTKAKRSQVLPDAPLMDGLPPFLPDSAPKSEAPSSCKTPLSFFRLFYTDVVMDTFVRETNIYGMKNMDDWKNTTSSELTGLFAIILFIGIAKIPNVRLLWSQRGTLKGELYGRDFVRKCMSYRRFRTLIWCLHYTNIPDPSTSAGAEAGRPDPFAAVNSFLAELSKNFEAHGRMDQFIDVDEMCIPFKGRHRARVYNPKKPNKWHFKAYCLNSRDGYLHKFFMYGGKDSNRPADMSASYHPVYELTSDPKMHSKNHVLCLDN